MIQSPTENKLWNLVITRYASSTLLNPALKYDYVLIGQTKAVVHAERFGSLGVMMVGMEAMQLPDPIVTD
jgi:hypothetical protein